MSTFSDTVAGGGRSGKGVERSNFTQTCNLLSQLLKEKRGSAALSRGMAGKMESRGTISDLPFCLFSFLVSGFLVLGHLGLVFVPCPSSGRSFS